MLIDHVLLYVCVCVCMHMCRCMIGVWWDIRLKLHWADCKSIQQKKVTIFSLFFRGFAFVVFSSPDAVEEVMKNLPHTIDGRQVDAKRAIPHAIHQVYAPQPVAEPFSIQREAFIPPPLKMIGEAFLFPLKEHDCTCLHHNRFTCTISVLRLIRIFVITCRTKGLPPLKKSLQ